MTPDKLPILIVAELLVSFRILAQYQLSVAQCEEIEQQPAQWNSPLTAHPNNNGNEMTHKCSFAESSALPAVLGRHQRLEQQGLCVSFSYCFGLHLAPSFAQASDQTPIYESNGQSYNVVIGFQRNKIVIAAQPTNSAWNIRDLR